MKNVLCLIFSILTLTSYAQNPSISDIRSDDNIPWAGEVIWDISLDYSTDDKALISHGMKGKNDLKILKLLNNHPTTLSIDDLKFNPTLIRNWKELSLYKDVELNEILSAKELDYTLSHVDTFGVLNLEIFLEEIKIIRNELHPEDLLTYRLKAIIYYDARTMDFKVIPKAIGVPVDIKRIADSSLTRKEGDTIFMSTLRDKDEFETIWMPITEWISTFSINSQDVTWATRLYRDVNFQDITPFKDEQNISIILQDYFERLTVKMPPLHHISDGSRFTARETKNLVSLRDTIVTFDPETFTEERKIAVYELKVEEISSLRFVLDWAWDDTKNELLVKQVAHSPLRAVYENGKFKYRYPLFVKYVSDKSKKE